MKITAKTLTKISLAINKMEISKLILDINVETGNEEKDKEEVGRQLIKLVIDNLYKAESEIVEIIASLKGVSTEEAEDMDIIPVIKELLSNASIRSFLKLTQD